MQPFIETIKHLSGAFTAGAILLGALFWAIQPRAEQFIHDTVQNKIDTLDVKLRHVERQLKENSAVAREVQSEQKALISNQNLIIELLKSKKPIEGNGDGQ